MRRFYSLTSKNKDLLCFSSSSLPLLSEYAVSALKKKAANGLPVTAASALFQC